MAFYQADLALSYTQIGLILWLPRLAGNLIEPFFFVLADSGYRRRVVLAVELLGFAKSEAANRGLGLSLGFSFLRAVVGPVASRFLFYIGFSKSF